MQSMPEPHKRATYSVKADPSKPLPSPQHEIFAQAVAKGASNDEAHAKAGFKPNRHNASRLKTAEHVRNRIRWLQQQMAEKAVEKGAIIDKKWVLARAVKLHETVSEHITDETGAFNGSAANVASRTLGQIGDHVDVQAWKSATDTNITVTLDASIARLAHAPVEVIEGDYEDVTSEDGSL